MSNKTFQVAVTRIWAENHCDHAYITEEEARKAVAFFDVKIPRAPKAGDHFHHPGSPVIYVRLFSIVEASLERHLFTGAGKYCGVDIQSGLVQSFSSLEGMTIITPCIKESNEPNN